MNVITCTLFVLSGPRPDNCAPPKYQLDAALWLLTVLDMQYSAMKNMDVESNFSRGSEMWKNFVLPTRR